MRPLSKAMVILFVMTSRSLADTRPLEMRFQLIVHPSVGVTSVSRAQVAEIFLKTRTKWNDGTRIVPVDQAIRLPVRARFVRSIYDKEPSFMIRYWHRKVFSGRGVPPAELTSDQEVIEFVQRQEGAVGYVTKGLRPAKVTLVEVTP